MPTDNYFIYGYYMPMDNPYPLISSKVQMGRNDVFWPIAKYKPSWPSLFYVALRFCRLI